MSDFYGIEPGQVPVFFFHAGADEVRRTAGLPAETQQRILDVLDALRGLHANYPVAFEVVIPFVGDAIDRANGFRAGVEEGGVS